MFISQQTNLSLSSNELRNEDAMKVTSVGEARTLSDTGTGANASD